MVYIENTIINLSLSIYEAIIALEGKSRQGMAGLIVMLLSPHPLCLVFL